MVITIKTSKSRFFFSGNIYLSFNSTIELELLDLTSVQLLDIIEAEASSVLTVSDLKAVKDRYNELNKKCSTTGGEIDENLTLRVDHLEEEVKNIVFEAQGNIPVAENIDSFIFNLDN